MERWYGTLESKEESLVDCIASGYEWVCPICGEINHRGVWEREDQCLGCQRFFVLKDPEHCLS